MKRYALMLAVAAVMAGCESEPTPQPKATTETKAVVATPPVPTTPSTPAVPPAPAVPPTPAAPTAERKLKGYFELKKDGKTYVTEQASMLAKIQAGDTSGQWAKEWTDVNGKTVVLQDDDAGLAVALKKEYVKSHPKIGG